MCKNLRDGLPDSGEVFDGSAEPDQGGSKSISRKMPAKPIIVKRQVEQGLRVRLATASLRNVRNGGRSWTLHDVEDRFRAFDLERIEASSPTPPISFVVGRRKNSA
jgi:hypothetical protein